MLKKVFNSFQYACAGIKEGFLTQHMIRVELMGCIFMNISAWYFHFSFWEYMICTIMCAVILSAELMNTALEYAIDLITKEHHPLAKKAKDCAAGAVMILSTTSVIIWLSIIIHKLYF